MIMGIQLCEKCTSIWWWASYCSCTTKLFDNLHSGSFRNTVFFCL